MPVNVEHIESWTVTVTPEPGETWPLVHDGTGRRVGTVLAPDLILLYLVPGQPLYVQGGGKRQRRDGTPGALRVNAPWHALDDLPGWARALADDALASMTTPTSGCCASTRRTDRKEGRHTMNTSGNPRNHAGHDGCDGREPLTLADRETMHGRPFRVYEDGGRTVFCARCLAGLPHGLEALFHVCDDELPPVRVGATVRYWGTLTEFRGTVWEVTAVDARGRLRLFDIDRAMSRVRPGNVEVLRQPGPKS